MEQYHLEHHDWYKNNWDILRIIIMNMWDIFGIIVWRLVRIRIYGNHIIGTIEATQGHYEHSWRVLDRIGCINTWNVRIEESIFGIIGIYIGKISGMITIVILLMIPFSYVT